MTRRHTRPGARGNPPVAPRGFTLLELLTTVAVVGVLLTVGVPSFFNTIRENRAAANANELVSALSIARSEAVRRGARVSLCPSNDGANCAGTWADGWIVFTDDAVNDAADPDVDEVLRVWPALSGAPDVTSLRTDGDASATTWVRFLPRGDVRTDDVLPVVFRIEPDNCQREQSRDIQLNAAGRTFVERVAC